MHQPGAVALRHTLCQPNASARRVAVRWCDAVAARDAVGGRDAVAGPSGRPSPAPTPTSAPGNCAHATKQVLAAETVVLHAQQALSRQLSALSAALAKAIRGTGASRGGGIRAAQAAAAPSGPACAALVRAVSAAQLAADQATADADAAQLTVAQQNLDNAIVRSPISGTVVSVESARARGHRGQHRVRDRRAGQLSGADRGPGHRPARAQGRPAGQRAADGLAARSPAR